MPIMLFVLFCYAYYGVLIVMTEKEQEKELYCEKRYGNAEIGISFQENEQFSSVFQQVKNLTLTRARLSSFTANTPNLGPECLDLSHNMLTRWPSLNQSDKVVYLNLSGNRLSRWYMEDMQGFTNLQYLDLTYNDIDRIDLRPLQTLHKLKVIYLFGNPMNIFGALRRIPSLQITVLSPEYWYAKNNLEFGVHRVRFVSNTSEEMDELRFVCSYRANTSWITIEDSRQNCDEIYMQEIGTVEPEAACMACFACRPPSVEAEVDFVKEIFLGKGEDCGCRIWIFMFALTTIILSICFSGVVYCYMKRRHRYEMRLAKSAISHTRSTSTLNCNNSDTARVPGVHNHSPITSLTARNKDRSNTVNEQDVLLDEIKSATNDTILV